LESPRTTFPPTTPLPHNGGREVTDTIARRAVAIAVLAAAAFWLTGLALPAGAHGHEIAILKSAEIAAYNLAVDAFKSALPAGTTFVEYDLQGELERGRKLAKKIRASDAALVFAVGLKAALAAKLEIVDIPIIFSMVLDMAKYNLTAPNMTGITMEVPVERQFTTMRSVLPHLRRIGVLYDPAKTGALVDEARRQARALGLDLIARPVQSEKDVPGALRAVLPQVEALWLVPDTTVLTDEALRFILSAPLDHNVPVIGFSPEFVRSGALVGLSVHYGDVGRQAGQLAKKILSGQDFSSIATMPPDRVRLALNLNTAAFLGLTIPPEVVSRADEVY